MQSTLSVTVNAHTPEEKKKCPFCNDKKHKGYHTKHGALKNEKVLRKNLGFDGTIINDERVKDVYPFSGGGDPLKHGEAEKRVFEEDAVRIPAAPHHIIPGDAAMSKVTDLEKWTTASKGDQIKEDIGYNIDGTKNGIFLPRFPDIFGTKQSYEITNADGTKQNVTGPEYYGRGTWGELHPDEKKAIAYYIMCETNLQLHQTSHGAKYISDSSKSYDIEAKDECVELASFIKIKQMACPVDGQKKAPYDPPYGVVKLIDDVSDNIRERITGRIRYWSSWCTRISEELTLDIKAGKIKDISKFKIRRVT